MGEDPKDMNTAGNGGENLRSPKFYPSHVIDHYPYMDKILLTYTGRYRYPNLFQQNYFL